MNVVPANRVRWIWLATTVSLAAALVVGSYVNYRGVVGAAATLNRGQADVLEIALRDASHSEAGPLTAAKLDTFVQAHRSAGLRFVAVLDTDGEVVLSAGQPTVPLADAPRLTESQVRLRPLVNVNGRVRASFLRPPAGPSFSRRSDAAGGASASRRRGPPPSWFNILEFVPVATGLVGSAQRALILAWIGAGILTLATLLFWRTSRRYDAARVRLEEQRRLTVLGEMSAVLAHEIRNPLASLKGHAQLLAERLPENSLERRKAERVVDEAKRLEVLTNDLLDFARTGPMDLQPVDPAALLKACAADVANARIDVDTTQAPKSWMLDERRFCNAVLANLLRNAAQVSPPDKPPKARVYSESGELIFAVRDYGPGLPAGEEHRLFDPFFTTRTTGTGLGLAVARRIAELHGGRISAQNAEGGGALFRVELPARAG